ncbi:hypothetical protein [Streptomyces sp. NPDC059455]
MPEKRVKESDDTSTLFRFPGDGPSDGADSSDREEPSWWSELSR